MTIVRTSSENKDYTQRNEKRISGSTLQQPSIPYMYERKVFSWRSVKCITIIEKWGQSFRTLKHNEIQERFTITTVRKLKSVRLTTQHHWVPIILNVKRLPISKLMKNTLMIDNTKNKTLHVFVNKTGLKNFSPSR